MSQINVDTVRNRTSTNGGPTFDKGLTVSAGTTAYVYGNLQVDGTETIVNTERLDVADKTVGIASTTSASNTTADGAGIEVYGGSDGNKTVTWVNSTGNWTLGGGGLSADSAIVGSAVTINGSGIKAGIITANSFVGAVTGNADTATNASGLTGTPNISCGTIAGSTGTFTDDVDIADKIVHTGDTNTAIRFPSADNISFEAGGVERLRIDNVTGNQVVAKDTTASILRVENTTAAASQVAMIDLAPANSLSGVQLKATSEEDYSTGANRTAFFTADVRKDGTFAERLRITSSGDVGINTTSPSTKLDVRGGITVGHGIIQERAFFESGGSPSGTFNINVLTNGMVYRTDANMAGTFTINLRGDGSTTFNSLMDIGATSVYTFYAGSSNTSYVLQNFQIDGSNITEKWNGGSAPSAATGSGTDVYTFNIMKTADATFTVFATFSNFA